tara:strand:- start:2160 stop:2510 length:351 start_codon:yes stop_codon:yes gene_type:complete
MDTDTEFEGGEDVPMSNKQYTSAMEELLSEDNMDNLSRTVSGVLEFLTVRASVEGPYYILADGGVAVTVFAANDDVQRVIDSLPDHVKPWEDMSDEEEGDFLNNADTGDEQDDGAK